MLRRVIVRERDCFFKIRRFDDERLRNRLTNDVYTWEGARLDIDLCFNSGEVHRREVYGNQHDLRIDAVLSL